MPTICPSFQQAFFFLGHFHRQNNVFFVTSQMLSVRCDNSVPLHLASFLNTSFVPPYLSFQIISQHPFTFFVRFPFFLDFAMMFALLSTHVLWKSICIQKRVSMINNMLKCLQWATWTWMYYYAWCLKRDLGLLWSLWILRRRRRDVKIGMKCIWFRFSRYYRRGFRLDRRRWRANRADPVGDNLYCIVSPTVRMGVHIFSHSCVSNNRSSKSIDRQILCIRI